MSERSRVFGIIDSLSDDFFRFASRLVQINTVNPPGRYEEIVQVINEYMSEQGFQPDIVQTPPSLVEDKGFDLPRYSILIPYGSADGGPELALVPHLDTVPAGDESLWAHPPFAGVIEDGKLYGRGACDCKGRLASYALALTAMKKAAVPLRGRIVLAATPDEEIGGELGCGYLTETGQLLPTWAITEGYINRLFYGNGGKMDLEVSVTGKSTHLSVQWQGVNAIQHMTYLLEALWDLEADLEHEVSTTPEMRYTTINVGTIRGGTKANVVPNKCHVAVDIRFIPEQSSDELLRRIVGRFEQAKSRIPTIDYDLRVIGRDEPYATPLDSEFLKTVQDVALEVTGTRPPLLRSRGGSDKKYFLRRGIPAVSFGSGHKSDSRIHEVDENLEFEHFVKAARGTAAVAMRLLGGEE